MIVTSVGEVALELAPWSKLQPLLDECYPRPPRDVFARVVAASHLRQRVWIASQGDQIMGLVMLPTVRWPPRKSRLNPLLVDVGSAKN